MKKTCVVMTAALVFAAAIAPAITSASSWNRSQARMRKAAIQQQKAERDFWKRFEAQMSKIQADIRQKDTNAQKSK